jgi:antibiotic biosynthesis monooxygenase (ABM) superfamily enzyme
MSDRDHSAVSIEDCKPGRMVVADSAERASAVIIESIPPERREEYLRWVRGITRAAESFSGYLGTNVFPPLQNDQRDWVTLIHYQSHDALEAWLRSDVRAGWVDQFRQDFGDFSLHEIRGGLTPWFAEKKLPGWKMMLTVLLGLFPTVMLITVGISPRLHALPFAISMLVGNALSVSALQWGLMPLWNRLLAFWLKPTELISRGSNLAGTVGVIGAIAGMLALFIALGLHA